MIVTTQQTDSTAHKLKPRLFHKSAQLQVHSADFHPSVNCIWHNYTVWFILYLIEKSLASINGTFMAWWTDLVITSYPLYIWETKVATLFLILASAIISTVFWFLSKFLMTLLSLLQWEVNALGFFWFTERKKMIQKSIYREL